MTDEATRYTALKRYASFALSGWRLGSTGNACCTKAVHKELVAGRAKSSGQFRPDLRGASLQIIELPALIALEVMMVLFACDLVTRGIAWHFDRSEPSFFNQRLNISINRRDPKRRMVMLSFFQGLFRRERPVSPCECLPNCSLLSCISLFHGQLSVKLSHPMIQGVDAKEMMRPHGRTALTIILYHYRYVEFCYAQEQPFAISTHAGRGNHKLNALILTSMAAVSTSIGGYCAVLLQRRIHLLMAFGGGVLIGAASLDLLPSALSAAAIRGWTGFHVFAIAALGAVLILCIGRTLDLYSLPGRQGRTAGRVSASLLIIHSTLDGTAIFAATTISLRMGVIVGLGVVAHDVCDGLNTILLSTGGRAPEWKDYGFLALDALAPIAGGLIAAHLFSVSPALVVFFLSLAAGSFLFTAIFGLFPDAWRHGRRATIPWVGLAGFLLVWCLTRALGSLA